MTQCHTILQLMWFRGKPGARTDICLLKNVGILECSGTDFAGTSMVCFSPNYCVITWCLYKEKIICIRWGYDCWIPPPLQESLKTFICDKKACVCAGLFLILSSFLCSPLLSFLPYVHGTVFLPWLGAFHLPALGPLLGFTDGYKIIYKMFTKHVQLQILLKYGSFGNSVFQAHLLWTGSPG